MHGALALIAAGAIGFPKNEPTALPPVEIFPESGMYDYHARYTTGATEFFWPARVTEDVAAAITSPIARLPRTQPWS